MERGYDLIQKGPIKHRYSIHIIADLTGKVKRKDRTMNTTTTTQNTTPKRYEDLDDFEKYFVDNFKKLPPEAQREVSAYIVADVKIINASPEQIAALCGRLGIANDPETHIRNLSINGETAAFWAACEAVDDVTDHKTIDELRAIRAAREEAQA